MLARWVNVRGAQEMLGHASLAISQLYTEELMEQLHAGVGMLPAHEIRTQSGRRPTPRQPRAFDPLEQLRLHCMDPLESIDRLTCPTCLTRCAPASTMSDPFWVCPACHSAVLVGG